MKLASDSLARRLSRNLVIALAVAWLIVSLGTALYVRHVMSERLDAALQTSALRLIEPLSHEWAEQGGTDQAAPVSVFDASPNESEGVAMIYQLVDRQGRIVFRSSDAPAQVIAGPTARGFSSTTKYRIYSLPHASLPLAIHTAETLQGRQDHLLAITLSLLLPLLAWLPVAAWLIHRVARRALGPVAELADAIARRGGNDLTALDTQRLPQELHSIAENTNHLMTRLDDALRLERQFATNAAHELRTPLAAARLRLQTALDQSPAGASSEQVTQAIASLNSLAQRTEKLLQLSRAEDSASLHRDAVDLGQLAAHVLQEFWSDPEHGSRIDIEVLSDDPVLAEGDLDSLGIALRNLIENALRHAGPQARIRVQVQLPASLGVIDDGPGVAAEDLPALTQRHRKASPHPASFGLGLAIVATIAERQRGRLILISPPAGQARGFEARMELQPWNPP